MATGDRPSAFRDAEQLRGQIARYKVPDCVEFIAELPKTATGRILQKEKPDPSSHCSSVEDRLATYGSEALDSAEHVGLILGFQKHADALLKHFGSFIALARASVQELLPFVSRSEALRLGAVGLREERQSLTLDNPLAVTELCSEMRFLSHESLRVVLLNAKQQLLKVATVSQGSVNETIAHPREIFKPVIVHSAYSFRGPVHWNHINLTDDYSWRQNERVEKGGFGSLRFPPPA